MPKRTLNYESDLLERLRDPAYAADYLRAALEDDEEDGDAVFLLALRDVAKANHIAYVAEAAGLNRETLYKMLSKKGNPSVNSLKAVLKALGLKLSVEHVREAVIERQTFQVEISPPELVMQVGSSQFAGGACVHHTQTAIGGYEEYVGLFPEARRNPAAAPQELAYAA